jgi:hypothetical protein
MADPNENTARLATIPRLRETTVKVFLDPPPTCRALRDMLDAAGVPRFKPNPSAKRGGGQVYYQVSAVEKLFRSRTFPGGAMNRLRTLPSQPVHAKSPAT